MLSFEQVQRQGSLGAASHVGTQDSMQGGVQGGTQGGSLASLPTAGPPIVMQGGSLPSTPPPPGSSPAVGARSATEGWQHRAVTLQGIEEVR